MTLLVVVVVVVHAVLCFPCPYRFQFQLQFQEREHSKTQPLGRHPAQTFLISDFYSHFRSGFVLASDFFFYFYFKNKVKEKGQAMTSGDLPKERNGANRGWRTRTRNKAWLMADRYMILVSTARDSFKKTFQAVKYLNLWMTSR